MAHGGDGLDGRLRAGLDAHHQAHGGKRLHMDDACGENDVVLIAASPDQVRASVLALAITSSSAVKVISKAEKLTWEMLYSPMRG